MIVVVCVMAAALGVVLSGGRLRKLADVRIRLWAPLLGALAIQIVIIDVIPDRWLGIHAPAHVVSYLLAAAFLVANVRVPGLALLGLGGGLNFAAILANGGVMPAAPVALARSGRSHAAGDFLNSGVVADPALAWLGDIFYIPKGILFANVFSIGDVLIVVGAAWGLQRICRRRGSPSGRAVRPPDRSPAEVGAPGYRRRHGVLRRDARVTV